MTNLAARHQAFADLHTSGCFVIPNPWDAGTARMMAACGVKALATTSAGYAFTLGRPDMGQVSRNEMLAHAQAIIAATDLPVSGDFENGFGDDPDIVAETVRLAGEIGLSGCSIEDTAMNEGNPSYDFDLAVERIKAAVGAARRLGRPFILCARTDGVMNGTYNTDEAIRRAQAFESAGADLLYAPLLPDRNALETFTKSVRKPVNALAAGDVKSMSVAEIAALGVRRISVGSMVARLTHAAIRDAVRDMINEGKFTNFKYAMKGSDVDALLLAGAGSTLSNKQEQ
jgi:2-methylisocitrate lyase-like PEP mutase family enzyme